MVLLATMKLHLFALMTIVTTGRGNDLPDHMGNSDLETLTLRIHIGRTSKTEMVKLRRINRVLANEYLPVWMTTDNPDREFEKLNIMGEVGGFSMYHDYSTQSAFVYFHKTSELSGVIDVSYYIKGFHIDETKNEHVVESKYVHHMSHVNSGRWLSRLIRSFDNLATTTETLCYPKLKVYPELLVAISNDAFMAIEQNSKLTRGIAIVSHVLIAYNAADMLYKLLKSVDIQLNIAGIVLESTPNQWRFETKSHWRLFSKPYIDIETIHSTISKYFWLKQNHFPRHSYDVIIYHTRTLSKGTTGEDILGQAPDTTGGYMFPPNFHKDRFNVVIKDFATYEHFTTIAHEMAHIFSAEHDGEGPYGHFFDMTSSSDTLMSAIEEYSKSSLKWSQQTEQEFAAFFRKPVYCNFKNYPRSLSVPEPKVIFSAKEQCECYGYKYNSKLKEIIPENGCSRPLTCIDQSKFRVVKVPLPMDGTPCGIKEVCWNKLCVKYDGET